MAIHSYDKQSERNYIKTASVAKKKEKKSSAHDRHDCRSSQYSATLELEMEEV